MRKIITVRINARAKFSLQRILCPPLTKIVVKKSLQGYKKSGYSLKGKYMMTCKRGDIFYADLSPVVGSEQGGLRPVLIIQNDVGNRYSPTVIAAAITSRTTKTKLPTHIGVEAMITSGNENGGLSKNSVILLEQIRTLDKKRLKEKMGHLDESVMRRVNEAIAVSFGLGTDTPVQTIG